jgi:hypothetical protein
LDGALLGAGLLKPELIKYLCWLYHEIHQFFDVLGNEHASLIPNIFKKSRTGCSWICKISENPHPEFL